MSVCVYAHMYVCIMYVCNACMELVMYSYFFSKRNMLVFSKDMDFLFDNETC